MRLLYFSSSVNSFFKHAAQPSSVARCLIFGQSLRLLPYFMCANSKGSGETAQMRRPAWAFAGHLCDKYHGLALINCKNPKNSETQNNCCIYPKTEQCGFTIHEPAHDKTNKMSVRPAKTQISLGIHPVWSESSLSAWRKLGSLATQWAHSDDSDQTGRMPRLIWVFAGCTLSLLGFLMSRLT